MQRVVGFLAFLTTFSALACAQGFSTLLGTVTDPTGAVVPTAKVTATQEGTGAGRSVATNDQGYYIIPSLQPSNYTLRVEAPGFKTYSQKGITLLADQSATVNVSLTLGEPAQAVTVEAAAVQTDTYTSTIKQVVDQQRMVDLPLNGRNAATLTTLVAGAVTSPGGGADQGQTKTFPGAVTVSANGSRQNQISYKLDGGNNVDEYTNTNQPFPFPDALQEFSVQTSNYSAEYGGNAGGVVNVVTKSGTNQYHGDGFGFLRNAVFNARNFFASQRDQLKRGQFGGTFGGPIRKDKTFVFGGYQGTRLRNVQGGRTAFVPTPDDIGGDFSALLDKSNPANPLGKAVTIKDPVTGEVFANNRIPANRFDPAALGVLKFLPSGGGSGLVFFTRPIRQNFDEAVGRVDHLISAKDHLTARYYYARFFNTPVYNPANILTYADGSTIVSQNLLVQETHIFQSNLLNEFRAGYARDAASRGPAAGVPSVRDFGVNIPFQPPDKYVQSISVSGFFSFGDNPKARFIRNNFVWADDMRLALGRHSISFGADFERRRLDLDNLFLQPGTFGFTGDYTGYAVADFLLGRIHDFHQAFGQFENTRNTLMGFYFQDNFRVNSRLTLNAGLRYEPFFPWHEVRGRVEQFRLQDYFAGKKSQVYLNAPPGVFFRGDPGVPENGVGNNLHDFAPRVGFAYDVSGDGKTSVRGGAGMFYDSRVVGIVNNELVDVSPFSPNLLLTPPPGPFSEPLRGFASPFPAPFPPPKDAAFPAPVEAVTFDPTHGSFVVPLVYNWNLAIERQVARDWLARLAYVGSHSTHIRESQQLNPAVYIPGSKLSTDQRRLFQPYAAIWVDSQAVNASYNSLQASLEKRFTHGLTILANYTFAKSIDDLPWNGSVVDVGADTPHGIPWYIPGYRRFDRGRSDFDRHHVLVVSYVWDLPKPSSSSRLVRGLLGNWEVTGIVTAETGQPFTVVAGKDISQTGLGADHATVTGPPRGSGACGNKAPCVDYLNPDSFRLPDAGTFGNVGKNSVTGPGFFNWDVGFFKNIPIHERWRLQFRGEFFNVFNRVNLNNPTNGVSSGGFGSIRGSGDPRIGQLALKIFF